MHGFVASRSHFASYREIDWVAPFLEPLKNVGAASFGGLGNFAGRQVARPLLSALPSVSLVPTFLGENPPFMNRILNLWRRIVQQVDGAVFVEYLLLLTLVGIGVIAGLAAVRVALLNELADLTNAISNISGS